MKRKTPWSPTTGSVERFIGECVDWRGDGHFVFLADLYEAYCRWCEKNATWPLAMPIVCADLSVLEIQTKRKAGRVQCIGIGISREVMAA